MGRLNQAPNVTDLLGAVELGDYGQIYVPAAARAAVVISDTTNYFEVTAPAWTLSTPAKQFDESDGNGRLTYLGAVAAEARVTATVSMTCGSSNQVTHWRIGENGVPDPASEVQRKIGAGADVGALALSLLTVINPGEYLSLWVRNATATNNITVEVATIDVVTFAA